MALFYIIVNYNAKQKFTIVVQKTDKEMRQTGRKTEPKHGYQGSDCI